MESGSTSPPIRVLIADDTPEIVAAWSRLLSRTPGMMALPGVEHVSDLLDAIKTHAPDVVLLDVSMPFSGSALPSALQTPMSSSLSSSLSPLLRASPLDMVARLTAAGTLPRVLIYSGHSDPRIIAQARERGASGYVGKHETPAIVLDAIRRVHAGETVFPKPE